MTKREADEPITTIHRDNDGVWQVRHGVSCGSAADFENLMSYLRRVLAPDGVGPSPSVALAASDAISALTARVDELARQVESMRRDILRAGEAPCAGDVVGIFDPGVLSDPDLTRVVLRREGWPGRDIDQTEGAS